MRSSRWRMLSGILIAVVFAATISGCSDRPTLTQPPPPGDGGGNGNPDSFYNLTATHSWAGRKHTDGTGEFAIMLVNLGCGSQIGSIPVYVAGINSWSDISLMPKNVSWTHTTDGKHWVAVFTVPKGTPDKQIAIYQGGNCWAPFNEQDVTRVGTEYKYAVPFSQFCDPADNGGGDNNPPPYTGPVIQKQGPFADGTGKVTFYIPGTTCETSVSDPSIRPYLGGIYPTWEETYAHMLGTKSQDANGFNFVTYTIPANTQDRDVQLPFISGSGTINNCWGHIVQTDPAAKNSATGWVYHLACSQFTRQDGGGGNPTGYTDLLTGSTDSMVTNTYPVRISSPRPGWWHIRMLTFGATLPAGVDQDRTHYKPCIGAPISSPDPVGYWQGNVVAADFPIPPDNPMYPVWCPLRTQAQVDSHGDAYVGNAWLAAAREISPGRVVVPISVMHGVPHIVP